MARQMRMVALAATLMLMLTGFAPAQRDDDDDYDGGRRSNQAQAQQYGYDTGYRDGMRRGREEGRENDPFDYRTPDWRQATRGYQSWMGPVNWFQRGYQEGYRNGFQSGFESANGHRGDADDNYDFGYDRRGSPAYRIGYKDGSVVARQDMDRGKRFNPNPRGPYDDRDHGYSSEYGDKRAYKTNYTQGYRDGYESHFRGGRGY